MEGKAGCTKGHKETQVMETFCYLDWDDSIRVHAYVKTNQIGHLKYAKFSIFHLNTFFLNRNILWAIKVVYDM